MEYYKAENGYMDKSRAIKGLPAKEGFFMPAEYSLGLWCKRSQESLYRDCEGDSRRRNGLYVSRAFLHRICKGSTI